MATAVQNEPVLIAGRWQASHGTETFQALNPTTLEPLPPQYPVSTWEDCEAALAAAVDAAARLRQLPAARIAQFLDTYADLIDANMAEIAELAHQETALPIEPRLAKVEGPRTSNQLRQAAAAAREGTWAMPTIDTKLNIRSCYEPIGPVIVFGPNNFPLAFGSVSGGDFAAAIAAGNPVIGKANTSHPGTTRKLAELARQAASQTGLPEATVQLIYRTSHADGERLVSDRRTGAVGYTGSRKAGLVLKAAADKVGKPIYLELSSVNPVVMLPGALRERGEKLVDEFMTSVLMGTGQFCTNPGLVLALSGQETETFIDSVRQRMSANEPGVLLSPSVQQSLVAAVDTLVRAGAELLCGGQARQGRCAVENTLLRTSAEAFLRQPEVFQTEAFGNASLVVVADTIDQLADVLRHLEGNLTGCICSAEDGSDDPHYPALASILTQRVGRLLNDKMPTGVAVSPAMNHGGPFPATGHPGFTAVGIPASIHRFAKLTCYDGVRQGRLPWLLQDKNPTGSTWRYIDGKWTTADVDG
ncbi:MAG: ketoglutarate semialdehyde dehydrogenase [Pirellulaceae bacterium]|nr:MAG: ketoglutarate semialdehyde dehydrogenase [Pirellulaceae bacterium]